MARTLNYIVLLSVVAVIVAASGCSGNTKTPVPVTPETPVTTPVTTPTTPVEAPTSTPVTTPETVVTPGTGGNVTPLAIEIPVQNVTHISKTQRNLQIIQNRTGTTSSVSNATITVKPSGNIYYMPVNPTNTSSESKNPFTRTGNNMAVAPNTGKLKIVPANDSTTTATGNQTIHISTTQRNLQKEQAALNVTGK
jgi:hypothetical protein